MHTECVNIKLGRNTILTVETPGGTTATIMPMSSKNKDKKVQNYENIIEIRRPRVGSTKNVHNRHIIVT